MVKKLLSRIPFRIVRSKKIEYLEWLLEITNSENNWYKEHVMLLERKVDALDSRSRVLDLVEDAMPTVKQKEYNRGYEKGSEVGFKKGVEHVKRQLIKRMHRPV